MKTRVSISVVVFFLLGLFLTAVPALVVAGEGAGGTVDVGLVFSPSDLPQTADDASVIPQPASMIYSDEVLKIKQQMQDERYPLKRGRRGEEVAEPAADDSAGISAATNAPVLSTNFAGIAYTGSFPPDCAIAAGPSHVLVAVNRSLAIYSKNGGAAVSSSTLANWFGNLASDGSPFDPKVAYDKWNEKFIVVALVKNDTTLKSYYLISVSQTSDPTGNWWKWRLDARLDGDTNTNNWADYDSVGFDSSTTGGVYITSNQFAFGGGFQYSKVRILKKSQLYTGGNLGWYDYWSYHNTDDSLVFTWQPVHTMSATTGEWFVNTVSSSSGNGVTLYKITNPTAEVPTITRVGKVAIRAFTAPPDGKQKGGAELIDTGDCRLQCAVFQSGYVYTATTEAYKWGDNTTESALRYLKLNVTTKRATLDKTYGSNGTYYSFPGITVDSSNNIYLIFAQFSTNLYGCVKFSGRKATDNRMGGTATLKTGSAYYVLKDTAGRNRWGDYSGIARDPSTGYIWLFGEYALPNNTWGTWIGKTKF